MRQTTEQIDAVIGVVRRRQLEEAAANRIVLRGQASSLEQARRYVSQTWPEIGYLIAPGQVWRRRPGVKPPVTDEITGQSSAEVTVVSVDGDMVHVGGQRWLNMWDVLDAKYDLVGWPAHLPAIPEPDRTVKPAQPPAEEQDTEEDGFDPRRMFVIVQRAEDGPGPDSHLPMISEFWSTTSVASKEQPGRFTHWTWLDAASLLNVRLGDYRLGWPDWRELRWKPRQAMLWFNELGCEEIADGLDLAWSAYLGYWLTQTITAMVVAEHGGTPDQYTIGFMWAPHRINAFAEYCRHLDPTCALPDDHPLTQCPGQASLL